MISDASATGHELGATLAIAISANIATAASGGTFVGAAPAEIPHALLIAGYVTVATAVATTMALSAAKAFLPQFPLEPAGNVDPLRTGSRPTRRLLQARSDQGAEDQDSPSADG